MYKFIKHLYHSTPTYSNVAYLYKDINTNAYYLSYTHPHSEDIIEDLSEYMTKPNIFKQELLKNITIEAEVTLEHFRNKYIKGYILDLSFVN